ncbi:hypothetical protein [Gymnodinialimonas sp. 57CJ19]|uniref:hypothetical protein n=1 Tax=Gymnodinialimonas sp. 57CJ19 TaxID=3138498 RepID=UPI003134264D
MKHLIASALTALCLLTFSAPSSQAQQSTTGWVSSADYQYFFDEAFYHPLIPVHVEAGLVYGHLQFNAHFGPAPAGLRDWATHHGMSDAQFAQTNQNYLSQGYRLHQHHRLQVEGYLANQGIWYR